MKFAGALAAVIFLAAGAAPARADEIAVSIPSPRPGITETFAYQEPPQPRAVAILFMGGNGLIGISGAGGPASLAHPGNFLIRARDKFVAHGIATIAVDPPSDMSSGLDGAFRESADYAQDIAAVIAWAHQKVKAPLWLVGTSMGTISAANVAVRMPGQYDGLVLTSSVSAASKRGDYGNGVLSIDLGLVKTPALVLFNPQDTCAVSPPENAPAIAKKLTASPRVALKQIDGGDTPKSAPCEAFSYHGYLGVEQQAVDAIADFILAK